MHRWTKRVRGQSQGKEAVVTRRLSVSMIASVAAAMATASSMAYGQDAGSEAAASASAPIEEIIVTGSRLIRQDLAAPSPVTVISEADIRNSGSVTIENTLNEFPQLAGGQNSSVNAGADAGVLTANLRGLGATRTLVLVNGRRFIPANSDGLVDLASIPDALVKNVEIITGGASAVYGSDAIAGAVNFILRDDFEGVELGYQTGITERGDAETHKLDLTIGGNVGSSGNVVLNASYTKRGSVSMGDRSFANQPRMESPNGLILGGSAIIPGGRLGLSASQLASLRDGAGNPLDLTPTGDCTAVSGIRFGAGGAPLPYCNPQDAYNYSPSNYLLRPLERFQISVLGSFDINERVEAYAELYALNSTNSYTAAPATISGITINVPSYAANPILPSAFSDFLVNNAHVFDTDGDGTATISGLGRRAMELGDRGHSYERDSLNLTTGLRGNFELASNAWMWDSFLQYQRSKVLATLTGNPSTVRIGLALDAVVDPISGEARCRNQILGCVPANIFGLDSIDPAAAAFLTPPRLNAESFERVVAGGSLSGTLFDLPAGPVAAAFGVEYRYDTFLISPGAGDLAYEYNFPVQPADGAIQLYEAFTEFRVPLLTGAPFADVLAFEGALRVSDYSTIGNAFTWKAGLEWAPVNWARLRTAYNVAIRAPTLNEYYSPQTTSFISGVDPCDASRNPTAAMKQLCIAQGIAPIDIDTFQQDASGGFYEVTGGNRNLQEEESTTLTFGGVFSPPILNGTNITIDYYQVKVDDAIANLGPQLVVNSCFASLDSNSLYCQSINRLPNGQIQEVMASLNNIASLEASGLDLQIDRRFDLPDALALPGNNAELMVKLVGNWAFKMESVPGEGQAPVDCTGHFGGSCSGRNVSILPDFKAGLSLGWNSGPLTVGLQGRMIGEVTLYPGVNSVVKKMSEQYYVDLSSNLRLGEHVELFMGIDNVFDKQPPIFGFPLLGDSNTDVVLYDALGRRYFAGMRVSF